MNSATPDLFLQWLLSASLRASALVLAVACLQLFLGRWVPARWRYAMWLPVVVVLAAPLLPESRFSFQNHFASRPAAFVQPASASLAGPDATTTAAMPTAAAPLANRTSVGASLLFTVWLLGVGAVLIAGGSGHRRSLRRIALGAVATRREIEESVARVAREIGLRRLPRVVMSTAVDSPAVTGVLRPVLLLPDNFPAGFSAGEARMVLLHELTHLKRHDLPVNAALCLLQAVHWFNPVLWLAFPRMRADREAACDAQVLGVDAEDRRADYGHALLKLQNSVSRRGLSLAFVGIFERTGMRSRIRAIAAHRRPHPVSGLMAAALIATLTLVGATRAEESRPDADRPPAASKPASPDKVPEKSAPAADARPKAKFGYGKFVSFQDGTLTLKLNSGALAVWNNLSSATQVVSWDDAAGAYKPAGTADVLGKVEAGTWTTVSDGATLVRIGARKGKTTGSFISFKDDRLLLLGKDLGGSYVKKYGNQVHFHKFADDVPVYESVDGGDYERVGTPATALPKVKEGTTVIVYGQGDDNITRIEIGVKK